MLRNIKEVCTDIGFDPADRPVGVAVSGGPDSMALLCASLEMGWDVQAIHCNFHLRGAESDRDERFVAEICRSLGVPLIILHFDVALRRRKSGESVEMACRSLRYEAFAHIARENKLAAILLGHNLNDNIETLLLNLLRTTGLKGTRGMMIKRDIYIRPLLRVTRSEILEYLSARNIEYVVDSTNLESEYRRNLLRNGTLRQLYHDIPDAPRLLAQSLEYLSEDYTLLESLVEEKRRCYTNPDRSLRFSDILANEQNPKALLLHLLRGRLSAARVADLLHFPEKSGRYFPAEDGTTYLLDRGTLYHIPSPCRKTPSKTTAPVENRLNRVDLTIPANLSQTPAVVATLGNIRITARILPASEATFGNDNSRAWFDFDSLATADPLAMRYPRRGDRFIPFGMKGSRLLSDFFKDHRIPLHTRAHRPLLTAGDQILWVCGLRASNLYPATKKSRNIIEFHVENMTKNS